MILDKFSRISLDHLPTAFEPLPLLSQALIVRWHCFGETANHPGQHL
jgi:hypothetical protein